MGALEVSGLTIPTDEDGFMEDTDQWSQEVAEFIAKVEGIDMTDAHWEVVNFLREYYTEYKIAPMIRILTKAIGKKLGKDKGNTKYLYQLYPGGPAKQACKIAGLPKPTGCV
ncbi:MAG: sulfurtransferase TusE [bacterium]|nr:MAG: sulfurtransferase TusE [bacterium]